MELRQLRYFVEVAVAGTYAAAAERLHVAQPGVWKQVQLLEHELGVPLFERIGRRVQLTGPGGLLLARAQDALAGVDGVGELAADLRAGMTGRVTVGCVAAHITGFLSPLVARHQAAHPRVRVVLQDIELTEAPGAGMDPFFEALRTRAADVVTTATSSPEFEGFPIYDVQVVAVPGPRHRWRRRPEIHVRELIGEPLVVTPHGYLSRTLLEQACGAAAVDPVIVTESHSPTALLSLGRAGVGLPVLASDAVVPQGGAPPIVVDDHGPLVQTVRMYARPDHVTNPAVAGFIHEARRLALHHT